MAREEDKVGALGFNFSLSENIRDIPRVIDFITFST